MAERSTYGKTWWGQQWLKALTDIDEGNRLPRGKTYANKGAVRALKIEANQISAQVQGSKPRPYKVKLSIPLFDAKDRKDLLREMQHNPALLAQLLNRQLPPDLIQFADARGIRLFPRSFGELQAGCSCPDYAMPCKHLAAVIYLITSEIDQNPFLVFLLKGLDLLQELRADEAADVAGATDSVLLVKDLLTDELPDNEDWAPDEATRHAIDFATLPMLGESLPDLLEPEPTFAKRDFLKDLGKAYRLFAKPMQDKVVVNHPAPSDSLELQLDELLDLRRINIFSEHGEARPLPHFAIADLMGWLGDLTDADWPDMSDSVRALYLTRQFTAALLRRGAVVPQLLRIGVDENHYRVRWVPATLNEAVGRLTAQVGTQLPPDLLTVKWQKDILAPASPAEQVLLLSSLLLRQPVKQPTVELWERWPLEDADRLFFGQEILRFDGFGKREKPLAIQLWLSDFFLAQKRFVPILAVEDTELGDVFRLSLLVLDRAATEADSAPVPLTEILNEPRYARSRMAVMQDLLVLSRHFPDLARLVQKNAGSARRPTYLSYTPDDFVKILLEKLPRMQLLGISLRLPRSLQHWVRPQVGVRLKTRSGSSAANPSFLKLNDMLTFDWQVAMGSEFMDYSEFEKLVSNKTGLVKINDHYVLIDSADLGRLQKQLSKPPELTGPELLRAALAEEFRGNRVGIGPGVRELISQFTDADPQPLPDHLNAQLRPYQVRGYDWLAKNTALGMGSILADDMGLGKTLQVITLLLKFRQEGRLQKHKALIVLPTTLLTNWQKEIARFAPALTVCVYHGPNRKLPGAPGEHKNRVATDLILTTYGVVRSDLDLLKKQTWAMLIIDEAQTIKNSDSEQTKAVKALKSGVRIALSGTPVENRLSEFWSIMDFVNRGYLGSIGKFNEEFGKPIQQERAHQKIHLFRRVTAPFLLRRVKTDKTIISDLPDKIEHNQYCVLTAEQAALYERVVQESMRAIEAKEGIARRGLVLKLMTALKQIGNHPRQYLKKGPDQATLSGKVLLLLSLLETIYASHEKVLIFTQYKEMGALLRGFIWQAFGQEPLFLHGGTSRADRDELVEQFQKNRSDHTFILSLKAGGTGLNLTQANHVIHFDLWWNPAVEAQATDRAFRIGQTKNVLVYRLINQGTLEEKIDAMIRSKKDLADLSLQTGETWLGDLSDEQLKELVALG